MESHESSTKSSASTYANDASTASLAPASDTDVGGDFIQLYATTNQVTLVMLKV